MTTAADQLHTLKFVTDTLAAARRDQLPQVIPSLTSHLTTCSEILCSRAKNPQLGAGSNLVHKLRTQISSLLQDKSLQGRWAAVVLVKTTVECVVRHQEGWEFLRTSTAWVRGLLLVLGKPDPVPTKTLTVIALTRIFLLTHGQPSLTREVTTPHLASFVTACLNLITIKIGEQSRVVDQSSPLLDTILQSLIRLLPNHPAAFRPFCNQIRSLISPLIAPTPSDLGFDEGRPILISSQSSNILARHLHALLPSCASKNGASEEWRKYVLSIIVQINRTADSAYRAILNRPDDQFDVLEEPADQIDDELMLRGWHGVAAGCERIEGLLLLLSAYLTTKSNAVYQVPIKKIYEMIEKLLSIGRPQSLAVGGQAEGVNRQFTREERESLYMMLPQIHVAALDVTLAMLSRMSLLAFGIAQDLLEQISWMAQRSSLSLESRSLVYQAMNQVVGMIGPSISQQKSMPISIVVRMACKDLLPDTGESPVSNPKINGNTSKPEYNADAFMSSATSSLGKRPRLQKYQNNALQFLCTTMLKVPASTLSSVRPEMDRVAVLLQHERLQLTSILNPQISSRHQAANLVPFLAKSHDSLVEALIHRRIGAVPNKEDVLEDDDVEPEMNSTSLEPTFVVPSFNSDLTTSFQPINRQGFEESATSAENPELMSTSTKRTTLIVDSNGEVTQTEENEHVKKKPRRQETENHAPSIMALDVATQSVEDPKTTEIEVSTSLMDKEAITVGPDTANSDSDDSFEIPEIIADLNDDDSEEEEEEQQE